MPEEQKSGFSAAFLIGAAIVALLFAGVYLYTRHGRSAGSSAPPPLPMAAAEQAYAPRIHFTGFKRVRASNFLDQEVTILFGNVTNNGDRAVREIQVQLEFKDVFNQVVRTLAAAGTVEVREDGRWFATLADSQWEVRAQKDRVLVHIWSDKGNLVRRVLRVAENTPERIVLEVQRFGESKPGRLEFLRADLERPERQVSREEFLSRFRELLAEHFPDEDLESLSIAQDLEHSLSSCYARGVLRSGSRACAVVGVSSAESAETQENLLVAGLLWLDRVRGRARKQTVSGLRLFLPKGASRATLHRLGALEPSTRIEVFEADCPSGSVERIPASNTGNLQTWLVPRREVESLLDRARGDLAPLCALAPESIAAGVVPGTRDVALRFRGIEFARWEDGRET